MTVVVQTLIDELMEYGFDITQAQALRAIDRRHKTMVLRARSRRETITVGTTVAGQANYVVDVLALYSVTVDGAAYGKAPRSAQLSYAQGLLTWRPTGDGLFVLTADGSGAVVLGLIPPPDTSGLSITALAALPADDLTAVGNIAVDDDMGSALVEGAAATYFARDSEQLGSADRNEQRFDQACEEFRLRVRRRFQGEGVAQIRVQGINA